MLWNAALFPFLESIGSSAFLPACKCDLARWDKRRREDGIKWDPLYWPLRAKLHRFCSGTGNGGAASGAKTRIGIFFSFLKEEWQSTKPYCFQADVRASTRLRLSLRLSSQKKSACVTELSANGVFVEWHRQKVASVHMVAKAEEEVFFSIRYKCLICTVLKCTSTRRGQTEALCGPLSF